MSSPTLQPVFPFPIAQALPVSLIDVDFDVADLASFTAFISARRGIAPALIGGYDEDRRVYAASELFEGQAEPRTVHLGVDIWTDAGTALRSPLPAEVHSCAINDRFGDYGGTVILAHHGFFTLYGHLAHRSVEHLRPGQPVAAGEVFAWLGTAGENGGWPPHLHFQRIEDMLDHRGDFPGVATRSERAQWLTRCPDPTNLLV